MRKLKLIGVMLTAALGLWLAAGSTPVWAQKPERPLRAVIPPPPEKETPEAEEPTPKETEKAVPPKTEKEEPAKPATEEKEETGAKAKSAQEAEEEKKQREEYLKEARNLVTQIENLRVTIEFSGGYWEEFRKRLLEVAFALNRVKSLARGPMARADSLGLLETTVNSFVLAKEIWQKANNKKDEANRAYQRAEEMFPETYRRYYWSQREPALGNLEDVDAPWIKDYFEYKKLGDAAKRESEQLMQTRDSYLNAAYSSLDAAKEALRAEGR